MNPNLLLAFSMVVSWAAFAAVIPGGAHFPVFAALAHALTAPTGPAVHALAAALESWANAAPASVDGSMVTTAREVRSVLLDAARELDAPVPPDGSGNPSPKPTADATDDGDPEDRASDAWAEEYLRQHAPDLSPVGMDDDAEVPEAPTFPTCDACGEWAPVDGAEGPCFGCALLAERATRKPSPLAA